MEKTDFTSGGQGATLLNAAQTMIAHGAKFDMAIKKQITIT